MSKFYETNIFNDPEWEVGEVVEVKEVEINGHGGEEKLATVRSKEIHRDNSVKYHLSIHEEEGFYGKGEPLDVIKTGGEN